MYSAVRRTGTYFHSDGALVRAVSVRAPQTTRPAEERLRRQLTPTGSARRLGVGQRDASARRPREVSRRDPAGAFQTPRWRICACDDAGQRAAGRGDTSAC